MSFNFTRIFLLKPCNSLRSLLLQATYLQRWGVENNGETHTAFLLRAIRKPWTSVAGQSQTVSQHDGKHPLRQVSNEFKRHVYVRSNVMIEFLQCHHAITVATFPRRVKRQVFKKRIGVFVHTTQWFRNNLLGDLGDGNEQIASIQSLTV